MKIAFVVHDYRQLEGHSRYVMELAQRFARRHDVHVFAATVPDTGDDGIRFHRVRALRWNALTTILSFAISATFCVRGRFDIVHNQVLCGIRGNVVTAHICVSAWYEALEAVMGRLSWRERVFRSVVTGLERAFFGWGPARTVIAVSGRLANDLRVQYGCRKPVEVIHHGVSARFCQPSEQERGQARANLQLGNEDVAFLFVGDLRKGAKQCVRALAQCPGAKLIVLSRSRSAETESLAETLGVSNRVHFAGPSSQPERFYAAADALLLPTPYDAFAMVVTEAMASGVPPVVSSAAGASEVVTHGVDGFILGNASDTGELAGYMRQFTANPSLARQMGARAAATIRHLDWDAVASRVMAVYERTAGLTTPGKTHPHSEAAQWTATRQPGT